MSLNNKDIKISFLVLDFKKPYETRLCLESIKKYVLFPHEVIYLDNGSSEDYPWQFKKEGLVDVLISNNLGSGCGNGMEQLYRASNADYCFMLQCDQVITSNIPVDYIFSFIRILNSKEFGYIDLAGAQAGVNKYSDRFGFFRREDYLKIFKGERDRMGGPGPYNNVRYTESYIQEYFNKNNIMVYHAGSFVSDIGKWSIREIGNGLYKHSTDEKRLWILKTPTFATKTYPPLNQEEWDLVLSGKWVDGTIPEEWKKHSFKVKGWENL